MRPHRPGLEPGFGHGWYNSPALRQPQEEMPDSGRQIILDPLLEISGFIANTAEQSHTFGRASPFLNGLQIALQRIEVGMNQALPEVKRARNVNVAPDGFPVFEVNRLEWRHSMGVLELEGNGPDPSDRPVCRTTDAV